ncbi:MAG TPA: hypothetical protein VFK05_20280, partial [Polyangiaceae bacterium]|nr:hypothetical protein [Polyangiaceae bacterium]
CCKTNPPPTWTADPVLCEQRLPWPLLELEQQSIYIPDYARLAACLAAYQAAAVDCDFEPYIACRNLFKGTILPGQMCAHGDACQEGSYCAFAAAPTSADTCAAITRRKLGEECNWSCTDRYCPNETQAPAPAIVACYESDGLYCDQTMVPNVCRRILSVGSPCKTGTDCGTYAVCDKTCKAKGSLGKDCAAGCPDYQTCDPDTYKCKYSPFDSPTMCTVPLP